MKDFNYEQKRAQLDMLLSELQDESIDVDIALQKYEAGLKLVAELEAYLKHAEHTVTTLATKFS